MRRTRRIPHILALLPEIAVQRHSKWVSGSLQTSKTSTLRRIIAYPGNKYIQISAIQFNRRLKVSITAPKLQQFVTVARNYESVSAAELV